MDIFSVLKGVSLICASLIGGIFLVMTYEIAETGSFEDACIRITNMIRSFMSRLP